jgi:hypothetical protein
MMMPMLSVGVTRLAPVGRSATGLRMSGVTVSYTCKCSCANGDEVCGNGSGETADEAKAAAHSAAQKACQALNSQIAGTCNYAEGTC